MLNFLPRDGYAEITAYKLRLSRRLAENLHQTKMRLAKRVDRIENGYRRRFDGSILVKILLPMIRFLPRKLALVGSTLPTNEPYTIQWTSGKLVQARH